MAEIGLVQIIQGALLAAGRPLTLAQLAELFEEHERPDNTALREALAAVAERCEDCGFELQEVASGFRFQVRQSLSPWVARLWQERPQKYSRALLETLALIAYRQPITRGEIEEIRGVAVSSNIIKTLHEREWIRVVGHRDVPGRPAMYATTRQFLDYFSLKSLDQLPALAEIRDLETLNAELGFSEPLSQQAGTDAAVEAGEVGPELTVVGGTEHAAALQEQTAAPSVTLSEAADALESRGAESLAAELESEREEENVAQGEPDRRVDEQEVAAQPVDESVDAADAGSEEEYTDTATPKPEFRP